MDPRIKIFVALLGLAFLAVVLASIRSDRVRPSYSLLWLGVSLFLMSIPVLDRFYIWLTYSVIGIRDARHTIYIGIIGFLLLYALFMTMKISQMTDQVQELVTTTAILEKRLADLEGPSREKDGTVPIASSLADKTAEGPPGDI